MTVKVEEFGSKLENFLDTLWQDSTFGILVLAAYVILCRLGVYDDRKFSYLVSNSTHLFLDKKRNVLCISMNGLGLE